MHGITKCKSCLDVLLQCRCFEHREINWVVCDDCRNGVSRPTKPFDHELKLWPIYFDDVQSGRKPFEVRINDRTPRYQEGHVIMFREYKITEALRGYTGREFRKVCTYIYGGGQMGLDSKYCVLGLADLPETAKVETLEQKAQYCKQLSERKIEDLKELLGQATMALKLMALNSHKIEKLVQKCENALDVPK